MKSGKGAIVVLGCGLRFSAGRLVGTASRRAATGAQAWLSGDPSRLVVASGGRAWDGIVEADGLRQELVLSGVPASQIVRERCSLDTKDNARFTATLLRRRGILEVTVVTCGWHLPRAEALFRRAGLDVIGLPAMADDPSAIQRAWRWGREQVAARIDGVAS